MPDQPPLRRRFQFRLRTLMIGVAIVAAVCWVIMDRQRLIAERDHALRQLEITRQANVDLKAYELELRSQFDSRTGADARMRRQLLEKINKLESKSSQSDTSR